MAKLDINDYVVIETKEEAFYAIGIPIHVMYSIPFDEVASFFQQKIQEQGLKPLVDEADDMQLFIIAYGTKTGGFPSEETDSTDTEQE